LWDLTQVILTFNRIKREESEWATVYLISI